jgi:hypothetical protein
MAGTPSGLRAGGIKTHSRYPLGAACVTDSRYDVVQVRAAAG